MDKRNKTKNIILFVSHIKRESVDDIREYAKKNNLDLKILLLRPIRSEILDVEKECDFIERVDFSKPHKIAEILLPYQDQLFAVTSSSLEKSVPPFAKVIPNTPYLKTPSTESLNWATDKYEMRRRLKIYDPKHTPNFTRVKSTNKTELNRVIEKVGFPMIVKPANLSASSYVTVNYHREELENNIKKIFKGIKKAYKEAERNEEPKVLAEEFMDGLMYSVDSYVDEQGLVYHCPLVRVKTGKDIGHDDFYNYIRITPTSLKSESIDRAQRVAESAIHALGLRCTTAHIELMRIDNDWKIIEIGARRGGFREIMYKLSCDINHTMNDIAVRAGKKPEIPKKCKGYCAMVQKFADHEGEITEMKGVKKIESLESFYSMKVNKKVGDRAVFARNGGKSIFNIFLYNSDRSTLLADIRRLEKTVTIVTKNTRKKNNATR